MIDAVKDYYRALKPNERKRLLMRMGISLQTLYRRTDDKQQTKRQNRRIRVITHYQ